MFGIDDALVMVGGSLLGNYMQSEAAMGRQEQAQGFTDTQQERSMIFNAEQAAINREFQNLQGRTVRDWQDARTRENQEYDTRMSNTQMQRRMQDLQAAGLNPMLAAGAGGASSPSASTPGASTGASGGHASAGMSGSGIANPIPMEGITAGIANAAQARLADKTAELREAEKERVGAETSEIQARTPTYAVNIQQAQQQIKESQERVTNLIQQTETSAATATNLAQQTKNLEATLPVLSATVEHLKAMAKRETAQAGLTTTEQTALKQKINANLPQLEAAVLELTRQQKMMSNESQGMENEVTAHSFIGALGAVIRALSPLSKLLP